MVRKITLVTALASAMFVAPLSAQGRVELSVMAGWTFSDGVDGNSIPTLDGEIFDRIDPQDSFKWSVSGGVLVTEQAEIGFQYGQQNTKLEAVGTTEREIGDLTVSTYHGYFAYNFFDSASAIRPYALFGLGATNFSSVDFVTLSGAPLSTVSETQFSTTWAAGVKFFPAPNFGAKFGIQWTPTYIKSDAAGYWCDPYWGCYLVGDAQYSNQWSINGGVVFRF